MLKIRLQRTGRVHETSFRIVVTESQNGPKSGKTLEVVGSYDPRKKDEKIIGDRIKYWLSKGAQLSGTVNNLLVSKKIIDGKKVNVLPKKHPPVKKEEEKPAGTSPQAVATPPSESAPKEEPSKV
jgi:small subunit ribosomal protein S16